MKLFNLILALAASSAQDELVISSTRNSTETQKTLITANNTKLDYKFKTVIEKYKDDSESTFLYGELILSDVVTYYAADPVDGVSDEIRYSIGWRNPEEDGYDVTSFTFKYDTDSSKITCEAVDGFSYGSIDSFYYNWVYEDADGVVQEKGDG